MKPILITLIAILTLAGCGKSEAKGGLPPTTHICREQDGKVINAFDKKECESYWGGTWEKAKPAG